MGTVAAAVATSNTTSAPVAARQVGDDGVRVVDVDHHDVDAPISLAASRRSPSSDVPVTITWRGCFASTASSTASPWWPGPCTTTVSPSCTPDDVDPVHRVGQRFEERELLGRAPGRHPVQPGAGEDLHVLAVAAPEPDLAVAGHVGVAVEAERARRHEDLVRPRPGRPRPRRARRRARASRPARRSRGRARPGTRTRPARARRPGTAPRRCRTGRPPPPAAPRRPAADRGP